jgi:hypothetical protein
MGEAIPRQHPAVVLRSQFNQLRALIAAALITVAGLTVAVVILANDSDEISSTSAAKPVQSINYGGSKYLNPSTGGGSNYLNPSTDGGSRYLNPSSSGGSNYLNPSTGYPTVPLRELEHPVQSRIDGTRYDGGPEEGTRGVVPVPQADSATKAKHEAATAAAIGQSNDGTVTHGSKTDSHGPASLLP